MPAVVCAALCISWGTASAQEEQASASILDAGSYWRVFYTLKPPVVRDGQNLRKLNTLTGDTPPPPKEWTRTDFDDGAWTRVTGRLFPAWTQWGIKETLDSGITAHEGTSPALALVSLRGKFGVTDPAAVKGLKLSLAYRGGVVVYVNGKEVGRANMPQGSSGSDAVAEDYPKEAFFRSDGSPMMSDRSAAKDNDKEALPAWKLRVRSAEIPIPSDALRQGVNLLAIEIHRAAYLSGVREWIETKKVPEYQISTFLWATAGLHSTHLESVSRAGLTPNVERPKGFQVWNSQLMQQDFDMDYGDAFEPLRPVKIVGSRGGVFSGKVVVGSDQPIKGLKAAVGELAGKGGKIPAGAVRVRYALPTGFEPVAEAHYPAPAALFDGLSDTPPALVDVRSKPSRPAASSKWVFGAVCPVWVTVAVPTDAAPGDYTGKLTITAEGLAKPFEVPVELKVSRWLVPKPDKFHTIVDLIESPESVAMQYEVPIYGDKHFKLLERSLEQMGHVGNWTVHIPLSCNTNLGNSETMVRWIKQANGTYKFDFSPMDRYLDLAEKHMGKPRIVFLVVWDFFLGTSSAAVHDNFKGLMGTAEDVPVSMLDEATGQVSMGAVGRYDEKGKAHWKTLIAELMAHLKKRGLDKAVVVGMADDLYPTAEILGFWKELLPDAPWGRYGHNEMGTLGSSTGSTNTPVGFQAHAWAPGWGIKPMYGWKRPDRTVLFFRTQYTGSNPWHSMPWDMARLVGELNIQGPRRGFGRIGLDFWPVLKNARGDKLAGIQGRFPKSNWRQLDAMIRCLVPPGPDGAIATGKIEMMREGLQETEARIFLESVLTDPTQRKRITNELAQKAQQVLDERVHALLVTLERQQTAGFDLRLLPWLDGFGPGDFRGGQAAIFRQWYMTSGWQERSRKLFDVAAEAADQLK